MNKLACIKQHFVVFNIMTHCWGEKLYKCQMCQKYNKSQFKCIIAHLLPLENDRHSIFGLGVYEIFHPYTV